jgi:hypothetical protein
MLRRLILVAITMSLTFVTLVPYAQKAMEMNIPIGMSPGVSNQTSIIGKIATVDEPHRTLTITDSAGTYTVTITDETEIWLDRSVARGMNRTGSPTDIKPGLTVEVKYKEPERAASVTAEWIKVQATN